MIKLLPDNDILYYNEDEMNHYNNQYSRKINLNQKGKPKTKIIWRGFLLRLFILFILTLLFLLGYFSYKIYHFKKNALLETPTTATETEEPAKRKTFLEATKELIQPNTEKLAGTERNRINILLLGMGGEGHQGEYLTDTIMLISIDPTTYRAALLSIPRDLYVQIPETKLKTKINAVYAYHLTNKNNSQLESLNAIAATVEEVTNQEIDYSIALDFDGFKKIIDELGGIDLEVTEDIYDPRYPGPNYSYQTFAIQKGFQHLDAETALKYARVRHTPSGDFGRSARQQQVIAAAKKKALSLGTIANPWKIGSLIDILGEHLKTNIRLEEISAFIKLAEKINVYETTNKVLDAWETDSLLASSHVSLGGVNAYVLTPRAKNYSQIHDLAENIFDLQKIEMKKEKIKTENAKIKVLEKSNQSPLKIKNSFKHLGYEIAFAPRDSGESDCMGEDKIISLSENPKIFTLDDLTAKLNIPVSYQTKSEDESGDILICISDQTASYFEKQNQTKDEERFKDQQIVSQEGKILTGE
ncbi:MAG TPA: LCP family protein [Candidatus Moranbacteria bacterium]|nr:LCP family protein [Candidatus Moranbacteria bacterium]